MIDNTSIWISKLNTEYAKITDGGKNIKLQGEKSLELHQIAKGLSESIKLNRADQKNSDLLKKVKVLAEHQLNYYKTHKFSFIEQFFSSLRNLFVLGQFHSSAFLIMKMTDRMNVPQKTSGGQLEESRQKNLDENSEVSEFSSKMESDLIKTENIEESDQEIIQSDEPTLIHPSQSENVLPSKQKEILDNLMSQWKKITPGALFIHTLLENLLKNGEIKSWEKKDSDYKIHFTKPIKGSYKTFNCTILENFEFKVSESDNIKTVHFPSTKNRGLRGPFGAKLTGIEVIENMMDPDKSEAVFIVEGAFIFNGNHKVPIQTALKNVKKFNWLP